MSWALYLAEFLLAIGSLLGLYRLWRGPDTLNRILALDYLCVCIISFICIYSIERHTAESLELILIFSLIGFATVLSFVEIYFSRSLGEKDVR